jgi:hypothetical protein
MKRTRWSRHSDEGVALVLVLVFMTVVGLFSAVALAKSASVAKSGVQLRSRGDLQYALDGGVDSEIQALTAELATGTPTSCTTVDAGLMPGSSFSLNSQTVDTACRTLAGRTRSGADDLSTSNYALVVTSPLDGALQSQSGSDALQIGGSVYINGKVVNSDLKKNIAITSGDLVSPLSASCDANLQALTQISLTGTGQLRSCTEQTLAEAEPSVSLGTAPTFDVSKVLGAGLPVGKGKKICQVFFPGLYTTPPVLGGDNYFASGTYYFHFTTPDPWEIDTGSTIIGGQKMPGVDSDTLSGNCAAMTDSTALAQSGVAPYTSQIATASSGNTWVFGGSSSVDFKNGSAILFTPPAIGSGIPVNIAGAPDGTGGYAAIAVDGNVVTGGTNNTQMTLKSNLYAPTGHVDIFSTNNTVATAQAGVVARTVTLKASNSGSGGLLISSSGSYQNPPPPFRTVQITSADHSKTSNSTNTAVVTISNFSPFTVHVLSWRTGNDPPPP